MTTPFENRLRNILDFGQINGPSGFQYPEPEFETSLSYLALYSVFSDPSDLEIARKFATQAFAKAATATQKAEAHKLLSAISYAAPASRGLPMAA